MLFERLLGFSPGHDLAGGRLGDETGRRLETDTHDRFVGRAGFRRLVNQFSSQEYPLAWNRLSLSERKVSPRGRQAHSEMIPTGGRPDAC